MAVRNIGVLHLEITLSPVSYDKAARLQQNLPPRPLMAFDETLALPKITRLTKPSPNPIADFIPKPQFTP